MRLWTLHPRYLDAKGLVALWREALLAQAVLSGKTRGYTRHPQLIRFRSCSAPLASIACYLRTVQAEASVRGYHFDVTKIMTATAAPQIDVTQGQLGYEWDHLAAKLRTRDPSLFQLMGTITHPEPHPLFRIVAGPVETWEILPDGKTPTD